jgi:hypothetical protein
MTDEIFISLIPHLLRKHEMKNLAQTILTLVTFPAVYLIFLFSFNFGFIPFILSQ